MSEHQLDTEVGSIREWKGLEVVFKGLWDRIKKTAEVIEGLREERRNLQEKVGALEERVARLTEELRRKDENLRELREHEVKQAPRENDKVLTVEEKEALKSRIKELLTKINSHL